MYFLKLCFSIFFILGSFCAFGEMPIIPYVGFDVQQRNMNFKKNYGYNIYPRKSFQNNVYLGFRLNKYFGLEGGYQSSQNSSKRSMALEGEMVLGGIPPAYLGADGFILTETTIRSQGPHLNVVGFFPIENDKTDFIASLGITSLTIKSQYKQLADNVLGAYQPIYVEETTRCFSSKRVIPRCMLGVQRKFTDSLGVRVNLIYEFTNQFKKIAFKNPQNQPNDFLPGNGALRASLRNSVTYGLGVFMNF